MAPELGLFLEECYYTAYNRRFQATHEEMSLNCFATEVNEFKKEFIYPHIVTTEARHSTFAMWLHSLNDRHYPDFAAAREAERLKNSQRS
jgi:tRNA pseudouridine38-40 synthase